MLRCCNCGLEFLGEEADTRFAELGDHRMMGTRVPLCPRCGSDDLEEFYWWEEEGEEMSADKWAWTEACDHKVCVGDCDLCDVAVEEEESEKCDTSECS